LDESFAGETPVREGLKFELLICVPAIPLYERLCGAVLTPLKDGSRLVPSRVASSSEARQIVTCAASYAV
jgi:hypothetical protein